MPASVLATKLHMPPLRADAVVRTRLLQQLERGAALPLALVSAPAGSGKSTLVAGWGTATQRPVAWLSLDRADRDPLRFLAGVAAALQTLPVEAGRAKTGAQAAGLLASGPPPRPDTVLAALVDEAARAGPFSIVLDDYHEAQSDGVDRAVALWLERMPPHAHLVVITREDPPLPIARLRARGHLTEIRARDLQFTTEEAGALLRATVDSELGSEVVATLEARTEGWAAGLQLAALSLRGHRDPDGFAASFGGSHRFVADYLVDEVLHRQPEAVQAFLLRTSLLDRLCGPLCNALAPTPGISGQETLEALVQANLFVVPLDDERRWFRYHHLFADLLRRRLPRALNGRVSAGDLHRRASAWYEAEGYDAEAVHHALAADDVGWAAELLERVWPALHRAHRDAEWLRWTRTLPEATVRSRPALAAGVAWALLNAGDLPAAAAWLREAERPSDEHRPPDPTTTAAAHAFLASAQGDTPAAARYARHALDGLPADASFERGRAATLLALALWAQGDLDGARQTFADGLAAIRAGGDATLAVGGAYALAEINRARGHLEDAARTLERALEEASRSVALPAPYGAALHAGLSRVRCEQGDLSAAAEHLETSRQLGEQAARAGGSVPPAWAVAAARLSEARGAYSEALSHVAASERGRFGVPLPDAEPASALRARLWLRQRHLAAAERWARDLLAGGDRVPGDAYLGTFVRLVYARVLLAQHAARGEPHALRDATDLLVRIRAVAAEHTASGGAFGREALVLLALAYRADDDDGRALGALREALAWAEPEGAAQVFLDEGKTLSPLLQKLASAEDASPFVRRLAATVEENPRGSEPGGPEAALTPREVEVLRCVATGLRNREVAAQLYVSLPTVKRHLANAYGKLGVRNRVEAVRQARYLGLV